MNKRLFGWLFVIFMAQACQAQTLVIARLREPSALSDVAQDIVGKALLRVGLVAQFKLLPLSRAIEEANEGEADGDLMRIRDVSERYKNLVVIPVPLLENQLVIYGSSPELPRMSRAQIAALKFGYVRGTFIVLKYTKGQQVTETQSVDSAFNMLAANRFDVIISTYLDIQPFVKSYALPLYKWPVAWAAEPLYLLLHKKNAPLFPKIEAALRAMKKSGEIDRIYLNKLKELGITPLLRE